LYGLCLYAGNIAFFDPSDSQFYAFAHLVDIDSSIIGKSVYFSVPDSFAIDSGDGVGEFNFKDYVTIPEPFGVITKNTSHGVVGTVNNFDSTVETIYPVEINTKVKFGLAQIMATVEGGQNKLVNIFILFKEKSNMFVYRILDTGYLDKYGGILYGMSGSPILQDGKLIGAVSGASPDYYAIGFMTPVTDILK